MIIWEIVDNDGEGMGFFTDEAEAWSAFGGVEDGVRLAKFELGILKEEYEAYGGAYFTCHATREERIERVLLCNRSQASSCDEGGLRLLLEGFSEGWLNHFEASANSWLDRKGA